MNSLDMPKGQNLRFKWRNKWEPFTVGSQPKPNIQKHNVGGHNVYFEHEINSEVDDLIINLANDPRNMFYATSSTGDAKGTRLDVPTGVGKNSTTSVTDLKNSLNRYRQRVAGLGLDV